MEFYRQEYCSGCRSLLQGIFLTQGLNLGILYRRLILHHLSHQGSPMLAGKGTKGDFQHSALSFLNSSSTLSVRFSSSVGSNSLWPHGLQHARPPCPSPTSGVYPNSCPLSWWCHPTISSSVIPLLPFSIFTLSQHQGLFQWVSSPYQVPKVMEDRKSVV